VTTPRSAAPRRAPRRAHLASRRYGRRSELSPRIDALFATLDRPGHPGGMVAVLRGGRVVHQAAYGVANVEDDLPFHARTVLRLGSTTKHVAATAILLLEDRGLLALDDDVRRFLPELPDFGATLRLRHLLTMTSGIPDGLTRLLFAGHSARHPIRQEQLVELGCRTPQLLFEPGEQCSYSNTNYSLLERVLERVTGTTLRAFLRREIFAPLGLQSTDLVPDAREVVPGLAAGYEPAEASDPVGDTAPGQPLRAFFPVELGADGGIHATLDDLVSWLQRYRTGAGPVRRWRERLEEEGVLLDGERTGYGLGWNVESYRGLRKVGHSGGMPGYLCDLALYEDPSGRLGEDIGFVGLWNWLDPTLLESAARVVDGMLEAEGTAAPRAAPRSPAAAPAPADGGALPSGLYACFETGELLHVLERDSQLTCFYLGESTPLVMGEGGALHGAKRGLGFSLRPLPASEGGADALDARFGASPPRRFRRIPTDPRSGAVVAPPAPATEPDEYAGRYRSDELGEEMIVTAARDRGALDVRLQSPLRTLLWRELRPVAGDLFHAVIPGCPTVTNVSALFRRAADGRVSALLHQTSRAGVVTFERLGAGDGA
jgi:CubicO group peptidase (beta-lactamase class C family)